jgi:hypothetical protein
LFIRSCAALRAHNSRFAAVVCALALCCTATAAILLDSPGARAATTCTAGTPYSNAVAATAGLAGYWRLGDSSGTQMCDQRGLNPGTYSAGATLARGGSLAGDSDTAAGFNGTSGNASVPAAAALNTGDTFSLEAWVKRGTTGGTANQVIVSKQGTSWGLAFNSTNKLTLLINGAAITSSSATVTDTTTWHHVVATKSGTTVKLYLDGADVTGTVSKATAANSTLPLTIGSGGASGWLNGTLDEVAVYTTALTKDQVTNHLLLGRAACAPGSGYSQSIAGTTGLVGYWRLGESTGTTACDSAGLDPGVYTGGVTLGQAGALSGDPNNAALFNGTTGWVSVPPLAKLNTGDIFTIEGWLKRGTTGGTANQVIASKQGSAWTLAFNTANKLVLQSGTSTITTSTTAVADTTAWHYVAATKTGATVRLYVDGTDVTGTVTNVTLANSTSPLAIGQNGNAGWFNGRIDEVALYNVALGAGQTSNHYSLGIVPANTALPAISGTATDGQTLTASAGTWSGKTPTYTYQWRRCDASGASCADISGATSSTYVLDHPDVGTTLRTAVTATNSGGSASATSSPTSTVAAAVPANTAVPVVSGTATNGQTLTSTTGTWSGTPGSFTYQWQRCDASGANCVNIAGATGSTYTLADADVGKRPRATVTSTNSAGSASASSLPAAAVADSAPVNTSPPTISGSPTEGTRLTSTDGTWQGSASSVSYQWRSCDAAGDNCSSIAGATSNSYVVQNGDHGHALRLVVTKSNASGSGQGTSAATQPATGNLPTINYGPTVLGGSQPPIRDEQLGISSASFGGVVTSQSFQWQRCDAQGANCNDIPGAIGSPYTLGAADAGTTIRIAHIATNAAGSTRAYSPVRGPIGSGAPVNTSPPILDGATTEGSTIFASYGGWSGYISATTFQWQSCDTNGDDCIDVTQPRSYSYYVVQNADHGRRLRVIVTRTGQYGSGQGVSAPSAPAVGNPPQVSSPPTVSGFDPPMQSQTLTAYSGSYSGTVTSRSFQWQRCDAQGANCVDLDGVIGSTYTLGSADVGQKLRVAETTSNIAGSTRAVSAAKGPVQTAAPVNTVLPRVFGTAAEGTLVSSNDGTWSGVVSTTSYQWQRCDSAGANCADVASGGTGSTYGVVNADHGFTFRLVVTKTGPYGSGQATSLVSAVAVGSPPRVLGNPSITGQGVPPLQGEELTRTPGSFGGTVTGRSTQWQRCDAQGASCNDIPGATGDTYTLGLADVGNRVRVGEVASNAAGSISAYSPAIATVVTGVPANTTLPTVIGSTISGASLITNPGQWSGLKASLSYQWLRCDPQGGSCVPIYQATEMSHDLVDEDAGAALRVRVTATNVNGSAVAVSAASGAISPARPVNGTLPEISGWARHGETLTASPGGWSGGLLTYAYQWQRCGPDGQSCADLGGATGSSYVLTLADAGSTVRVRVSASNTSGTISATSAPSELVDPPAPTNTSAPTVAGLAMEGQRLEARPGTWVGGSPRYQYQWQRCDEDGINCEDMSGATEKAYTLYGDDIGHTMRAVVTATSAGGSATATAGQTSAVEALPAPPAPPEVLGEPGYDKPLTVQATAPESIPNPQFKYQWQRCDEDSGDCEDIPGATSVSYTPKEMDLGYKVRANVIIQVFPPNIGELMVDLYNLATGKTPTLTAGTHVSGTRDPNAPLVIDPSSDPVGRGTDELNVSRPVAFIQSMPSTKRVTRVTLGDISASSVCTSNSVVNLIVREHPTGDLMPGTSTQLAGAYPGTAKIVARSTAAVPATSNPRQLRWTIPTTTFQSGYGYSFALENYGGCGRVDLTSWAHNRSVVNPGPVRCELMTPGLEVYDAPYGGNSPATWRMWHEVGHDDGQQGCLQHGWEDSELYKPDMPTGWLTTVSYNGEDRYAAVTGVGPAAGTDCDPTLAERGGRSSLWGGELFGGPVPAVCRWSQFAPYGHTVGDGWYYGLPWRSRYHGAPRDVFVQLDPEEPDPLAKAFEPVLRFDESEKWRPLDIGALVDEGKHRMCPVSYDGGDCSGGEPFDTEQDFVKLPYGHLDLDGEYTSFTGTADSYHSPYAHCRTLNGDSIDDCDSGPQSSLYFRKVDRMDEIDHQTGTWFGYTFYDYWAFYRANQFLSSADFHVGDWEAVSVALNMHSTSHPTFDYVTFSQHGHYYAYLRENLACEDSIGSSAPPPKNSCGTNSKRVVSMVANGSHANYAVPCSEGSNGLCKGDASQAPEGYERGHSGAHRWGNAFDTTALRVMPSTWENWEGMWGESLSSWGVQDSPASPGRQDMSSTECARTDNDEFGLVPCDYKTAHPAPAKRRFRGKPHRRGAGSGIKRVRAQRATGSSYHSPGEAAAWCSTWNGADVAATVCDPAQLKHAAEHGTLGEPGKVGVSIEGARGSTAAASAPGIAQLSGPLLNDGDHLALSGAISPNAVLSVRVADPTRGRSAVARFRLKDLVPRKARRGTHSRLRVGVHHRRGRRLSVRINGRPAKSVKVEPRHGKRRHKKHHRHHGRRHP